MSSIIERRIKGAARVLGIASLIAGGWMLANAAILAATEKADAVLVLFAGPVGSFPLPPGVAILDWDGRSGRFVGTEPGYVADLYRSGALLVLPARGGGCVAFR
ncbi:hypothetical protein [Aureimonas psammosilenae]|uniref:hypothetical protein n=1 Tax=Aureimonas psammosilenae TaxID=2495496 RepID=UPI001F4315B7|nr:hypothetical protein [Aureimonas psammosilenae]